jgi:plastocyanin
MEMFSTALLVALLAPPPAPASSVAGRIVLVENGAPRPDASNAVVWLEGVHRPGGAPEAATMTQSLKRFVPGVVVVPVGGTVRFPNEDPIYHNVFSVSGANRFDLGLYRSGTSKSRTFSAPGLVRVYCNIHPQMVGFVMVVDSDFFAVTGPDGSFRLEDVPAGRHRILAWHEGAAEVGREIVVPAAESDAPLTLRIDVSGFRPGPHKNKYGRDYPPLPPESENERY